MNNKEKNLTALLKVGNEAAFKEFYLCFYKAVLYYVSHYIQNSESAKDIAQESFFYLWENRDKLDPSKGCKSYMLSIARSKALNYIRDTKYSISYVGDDKVQMEFELHADLKDYTFNAIINKDLLKVINDEIAKLPQKQRDVIILSRKKYCSHKEIAQILQISVKAVEYRLMSALSKIKKNIENI
ncbi:MAG: RNA polymerase sigma-70 factor [Bacteroidales bacterium]